MNMSSNNSKKYNYNIMNRSSKISKKRVYSSSDFMPNISGLEDDLKMLEKKYKDIVMQRAIWEDYRAEFQNLKTILNLQTQLRNDIMKNDDIFSKKLVLELNKSIISTENALNIIPSDMDDDNFMSKTADYNEDLYSINARLVQARDLEGV